MSGGFGDCQGCSRSSEAVLTAVGMENRLNIFQAQLSGGGAARVSIARAAAKIQNFAATNRQGGLIPAAAQDTYRTCLAIKNDSVIVTHNALAPLLIGSFAHAREVRVSQSADPTRI